MSAAKLNFDLLHLREDPFHYKSGTCSVILHISQEAISKRGGEREGHSKVTTLLPEWCKQKSCILTILVMLQAIGQLRFLLAEARKGHRKHMSLMVCRVVP